MICTCSSVECVVFWILQAFRCLRAYVDLRKKKCEAVRRSVEMQRVHVLRHIFPVWAGHVHYLKTLQALRGRVAAAVGKRARFIHLHVRAL